MKKVCLEMLRIIVLCMCSVMVSTNDAPQKCRACSLFSEHLFQSRTIPDDSDAVDSAIAASLVALSWDRSMGRRGVGEGPSVYTSGAIPRLAKYLRDDIVARHGESVRSVLRRLKQGLGVQGVVDQLCREGVGVCPPLSVVSPSIDIHKMAIQ